MLTPQLSDSSHMTLHDHPDVITWIKAITYFWLWRILFEDTKCFALQIKLLSKSQEPCRTFDRFVISCDDKIQSYFSYIPFSYIPISVISQLQHRTIPIPYKYTSVVYSDISLSPTFTIPNFPIL